MYSTTSNNMRIKGRVIPIHSRCSSKFQNLFYKNKSTQTLPDFICKDHSEQITQLLTEIAIALGQKAKLENHITELKQENSELNNKLSVSRTKLLSEIEQLKRQNVEAEMEFSKLKITHLEEQKVLLTEVSNLKSEIQNLNQENEYICQNLKLENNQLEQKVKVNKGDLQMQAEKNATLQLKLNKYKTKLKCMVNYVQNLLQEFRDKQSGDFELKENFQNVAHKKEPSVEDVVLSELFFQPIPPPAEVADLFFRINS